MEETSHQVVRVGEKNIDAASIEIKTEIKSQEASQPILTINLKAPVVQSFDQSYKNTSFKME